MKHAYDSSFISPSYFQDNFSVDGFLITLTKDVIDPQKRLQHNSNSRALTTAENAQASIDRVQQLLRRFARAEEEIGVLSSEVSAKLTRLQLEGRHHEEEYKAEVKVLERVGERIKCGIRDIDSRVSHISQTATRIGDRLQSAESLRMRCLEAQELVSHLQAFSCHTGGEDFSQLPPIFTNQATMAEAAAVSRRLLLLAGEVLAAKQRTKLAAPMDLHHMATPGNTGGLGSVEHTLKVLESYCNWLENRVICWFDSAVADNNLVLQGQCAAIMRQLDKEKSITQQEIELQRLRLRLLSEGYGRTARLAVNLERAVKTACQLDVVNMAEGLWPTFMGDYPQQELAWLQAAVQAEVARQDSPELSLDRCKKIVSWNKEATARCLKLSPPGQGVEYSLELCNTASSGSISSMLRMGFGAVSSASSHQVAVSFVNDKIRKALEAAHVAGKIVSTLQAHFSAVVVPALSGSVGELSAASSALLALIRAAEDSITVVLRKSVDATISQLDRLLSSEQRRSDFLPRDDELTFDRPTAACLLGTALLAALGQAAQETLDGTNLRQFLAEVARRAYHLLLLHMTRYIYSPTGALKWKKDVSEYAEVLCSYQVPAASEDMSHLQQLVNVLVVAPDSLLGLVNGSLRMSHRDALRFISLREDFRTAKVQGKSLLQLFSGEGMEKHIGQMAS
eukprot:gene13513-13638_t